MTALSVRRPLIGLLVVVAGIFMLAGQSAEAAPRHHHSTHTEALRLRPVLHDHHLNHAWHFTRHRRYMQCDEGSGVGTDSYRCTAGHGIYDPCVLASDSRAVCVRLNAWTRRADIFRLNRPYEGSVITHHPAILDVQLNSGSHCTLIFSGTDTFHGHRVSYYCGHDLYLLDPISHGKIRKANSVRSRPPKYTYHRAGRRSIAKTYQVYGVPGPMHQ